MFEGWDAAGKGGAIRRVTAALDARAYQVIPIAAPTDEERAHHYLWRFWRHLPRAGRAHDLRPQLVRPRAGRAGRGLRRAGGMAARLRRDQRFEEQLVEHGIVLVKFWLHITADEQLRRFKERERLAVQALEADRRGLAQPEEMGRVRAGGERHGRADQHQARAVDPRRGQRQVLRADQGAQDDLRTPGGGALNLISSRL